jgi:soluble lytic murein transglycosylase
MLAGAALAAAGQPYGAAMQALQSGHAAEAARLFASVDAPLQDWALLHRGQALLAAGELPSAAAVFTQCLGKGAPAALRAPASEGLSDCLARQGKPGEAAATLAGSLDAPRLQGSRLALLAKLAELRLAAGSPAGAYSALLDAVESPGESVALTRSLHQQLLDAHALGQVTPVLGQADLIRWARFLARKGRLAEALGALALHRPETAEMAIALELMRARYESRLGKREQAALSLRTLAATASAPSRSRSEALLLLARVLKADRDLPGAASALEELLSLEPDSARAATARLELASLMVAQKRPELAQGLRAHVRDRQPATPAGRDLLWQDALESLRTRKFAETVRLTGLFLAHHKSERLAPSVRYWQAVAKAASGQGKAELKAVADGPAIGYFKALAASRLNAPRPRFSLPGLGSRALASSSPSASSLLPLEAGPTETVARALASQAAWEDLAQLLEQARRDQPANFAVRHNLSLAYSLMHRHQAALRIAEETARSTSKLQGVRLKELDRLLYPAPFLRQFVDRCGQAGVNPFLALAVAREESRFQPENRSRSDARGLMQILPSTGKWLAGKAGLGGFEADRLYEPDLNIRLGVQYLAYLRKKYESHGSPDLLAMAAYNGGPGNVDRWLKQFGNVTVDEFVERIPLEETRYYVKKVSNSALAYERVLGAGAGVTVAAEPEPAADLDSAPDEAE